VPGGGCVPPERTPFDFLQRCRQNDTPVEQVLNLRDPRADPIPLDECRPSFSAGETPDGTATGAGSPNERCPPI
jgi:hypothetical protein